MIIQGSPEWFSQRCGKVTASRIVDVMATVKSGESASRANYRAQLVVERLTGNVGASFTSAAMQHGIDTEPLARMAYECETLNTVTECAMIVHPWILMSGASPDGLVDADGLVEIKCPNSATRIETLLSGKAPSKYIPQMQWQMACTGRKWCDFVSFDPRMPEDLQILIVRVTRNDDLIDKYEDEVIKFLSEVDAAVASIHALRIAD
jgi:putative phage-type endonuclease